MCGAAAYGAYYMHTYWNVETNEADDMHVHAEPVAAAASTNTRVDLDHASTGSTRTEAALEAMRELRRMETNVTSLALGTQVEALRAAIDAMADKCQESSERDELRRALHTLHMLVTSQLRRPKDQRYHRLNRQNASLSRVLGMPGASEVLGALGFVDEGGPFLLWRGGQGKEDTAKNHNNSPAGHGDTCKYSMANAHEQLPNESDLALIRLHKNVLAFYVERMTSSAAAISSTADSAA